MDDKGFFISRLYNTQRVPTRNSHGEGKFLWTGQDGSRQWITVVATTCVDDTR